MVRYVRGAIASLLAASILMPAIVLAQQNPSTPGQGLEISPPLIELSANPGQTITANIRIRNVTRGELVVNGKADDFGAKGEEGEPQLLLDEKEAGPYSLKFWVPQVPSFRLVPGEVKTAQVNIVVPANAEPGGHYGVIRFTGTPPELEGTGVSLSASIGTLVLLKVSGEISENLSVEEFFASYNGKKGGFFETGPITLTERLRNTGSVHVKPVGYVEVFDLFGKRIAQLPISNPARNVLPDSVRKFEQKIDRKNLFGPYKAKFSADYGNGKKLESKVMTFWVVPYKLILLIVLILIALVLGLRHGIKRYNRWVIAQARKR